LSEKVKLKKCLKEDLLTFVPERSTDYYKNSVCFEDREELVLNNNWLDEIFESVMISIDGCNSEHYPTRWERKQGTCTRADGLEDAENDFQI
jgi:hypothetical protein